MYDIPLIALELEALKVNNLGESPLRKRLQITHKASGGKGRKVLSLDLISFTLFDQVSHTISSYIANDRGICPVTLIHAVDICSFMLHWLGIKEFQEGRLVSWGASA